MAKEYFEKLSNLINKLEIETEVNLPVAVKHFFDGAVSFVPQPFFIVYHEAFSYCFL